MAVSASLFKDFCVGFLCLIFFGLISAEVSNESPGNTENAGQGSSYLFYQNPEYPRDCSEVRDSCSSTVSSGVHLIKPEGYEEPFEVYCDNDIDSGGWTTILRRFDTFVNFKRNWTSYKHGFGFLSTEFWIGLDKLSFLTNQKEYELRIEVTLEENQTCDVTYDAFRISDEFSDYKILTLGTYKSDVACRWNEGDAFKDCNDVFAAGHNTSGVYFIFPEGWNEHPFEVFCNMSIDGGNWTVIQRRKNGSTDFYRNWEEYSEGFGDITHEFWLGNEKLHFITRQATYEYRFDFVYSGTSYYNKYTNFQVGNKANKYRLANVGSRTGTLGYSLYQINNTTFSTRDKDNDGQSYDCAEGHQSGWWHGAYFYAYSSSYCYYFPSGSKHVICSYANPNGEYSGGNGRNIFDYYSSYYCNQKYTEMKIRRIS